MFTTNPEPIGSTLASRFLRIKEVIRRTGLARSTLYDHIKRGTFPVPVRLGPKLVGWIESEINLWLQEQISTSRGGSQ